MAKSKKVSGPSLFCEWMVGTTIPAAFGPPPKPKPKPKPRARDVVKVNVTTDDESEADTVSITYPRTGKNASQSEAEAESQSEPESEPESESESPVSSPEPVIKKVRFDASTKPIKIKSALKKRRPSISESEEPSDSETEVESSGRTSDSDMSIQSVRTKRLKKQDSASDIESDYDLDPHPTCKCGNCTRGRVVLGRQCKKTLLRWSETETETSCAETSCSETSCSGTDISSIKGKKQNKSIIKKNAGKKVKFSDSETEASESELDKSESEPERPAKPAKGKAQQAKAKNQAKDKEKKDQSQTEDSETAAETSESEPECPPPETKAKGKGKDKDKGKKPAQNNKNDQQKAQNKKHQSKKQKKESEDDADDEADDEEEEAPPPKKKSPPKKCKQEKQAKEESKSKKNEEKKKDKKEEMDSQPEGLPLPNVRRPNYIQPVRAEVVQAERVVEGPDDPPPNAYFDPTHNVMRVYYGPAYGKHHGHALYPTRANTKPLPIGTPHPTQNPWYHGFENQLAPQQAYAYNVPVTQGMPIGQWNAMAPPGWPPGQPITQLDGQQGGPPYVMSGALGPAASSKDKDKDGMNNVGPEVR